MNIKGITRTDTFSPHPPKGEVYTNRLLIAMPGLQDVFEKSVIYVCAHSEEGAMGIVVNQKLPHVVFRELMQELEVPDTGIIVDPVVHFGGPVETGRGFVLHSSDFQRADTVHIRDNICMTGTVDILQAMAEGHGPDKSIFALGYTGWGPGQLEEEIQANNWLDVPADAELIFSNAVANKWETAMHRAGIDPVRLSFSAGHA